MKKIISFLGVLLILFDTVGFAQTMFSNVSINGLILNQSYSVNQIVQALGTPSSRSENRDEGILLSLKYQKNTLYLNNGVFDAFELLDNSYKLNNIVGVGDDVRQINLLNPFSIKIETKTSIRRIYNVYMSDPSLSMSPISFYIENDRIVRITYVYLDGI